MSSKKIVFIAWEKHRRSEELCKYFSFDCYLLHSDKPRYIRHPYFMVSTLSILLRLRPAVVIVQNPSIVLSFLACLFRPFFHYKLVVDAHNGAIIPDVTFSNYLTKIYSYVQKQADLTVVTNAHLAEVVLSNHGNPFILQDKFPEIASELCDDVFLQGNRNIVFICSFGQDEPFEQVLLACSKLDTDIAVYITGRVPAAMEKYCRSITQQLVFTGYLQNSSYFSLLQRANLIIDLTTREDCLVCAAYEAVSLGTPVLLSDSKVLKEYFYKGCIFTSCQADDIFKNIKDALDSEKFLRREIGQLKIEVDKAWKGKGEDFIRVIQALVESTE